MKKKILCTMMSMVMVASFVLLVSDAEFSFPESVPHPANKDATITILIIVHKNL